MSGTTSNTTTFGYSGQIVTFTAPATGAYEITTLGVSGGSSLGYGTSGGVGEQVSGGFQLTQGEVLQIAVGGAGGTIDGGSSGGGSFVVASRSVALEVAGGGLPAGLAGGTGATAIRTPAARGGFGIGGGSSNAEGGGGGGYSGGNDGGTTGYGGGGSYDSGTN